MAGAERRHQSSGCALAGEESSPMAYSRINFMGH
jgi:uncharacterized protein (DUF779 family)